MDANAKGEYALLRVKQLALEKSVFLSEPTMANCRYDLVVDCGDRLLRAQVKWADGKSASAVGCVQPNLRKITRGNKRGKQFYTADEVDVLLVYVPKIDKVLWLEAAHFHGKQSLNLRIEPTRNKQSKGCLMAENFIW